jgi:hypothetical protein
MQIIILPTSWKDHWSTPQRQLHRIVYVALLEFQKSVVDLVTKWVELDVKRASRLTNTPEDLVHSIRRASEVHVWAKKTKPLSYEDDAYQSLSKAIHEDPLKVGDGLPASDPKQMSLAEFAILLARMGMPSSPAQVGPPVEKSSPYIYTLRSCVALFFNITGTIDDKTKIALFVNHATELCAELGINYIPWSAGYFPPSGKTSGISRCNRDVVPTRWITLGAPAPPLILPRNTLTPREAIGLALSHSRRESMRGHPAAAWSVSELVLRDLGSFLERRIKPTDWALAHAHLPENKDDLVTRTYHWVNDNLDLHNPVHHVTFLTAIIIAKALPTVAYALGAPTAEPAEQVGHLRRESVLTELVRQVPWTDGGRGTHQPEPFLVMFVVGFLAWKEKGSPLRAYYRDHSSVGPTWSAKHREFPTSACRLPV